MNPVPAILYVLRVALQNIVRNRGIAFASVLTVTLTLLGAGAAVAVVSALDGVLHQEETQASVLKVFIADHVSFASALNLEHNLGSETSVLKASFENKNQAAKQAASSLGLSNALKILQQTGAGNPLPASINLHLRNIAAVSSINNQDSTSALL